MDRIATILSEVHSKPSFERYEESEVRKSTNCYSHALGATSPYLENYRVGAISKKKQINEKYTSIEEIKELLFSDCEALQLKIEESSLEEELSKEEYKIQLFVKIWANGMIGDYHFWREHEGVWTEKWRGDRMRKIQDTEKSQMRYFPWNFVGIYKISR